MKAELTATVEGGVLKPDIAIPFPDCTRVKLTIEPVESRDPPLAAWERLLRLMMKNRSSALQAGSRETSCMNAVDTNALGQPARRRVPGGRGHSLVQRGHAAGRELRRRGHCQPVRVTRIGNCR